MRIGARREAAAAGLKITCLHFGAIIIDHVFQTKTNQSTRSVHEMPVVGCLIIACVFSGVLPWVPGMVLCVGHKGMDNPSHGPCPQRAQKVEGHRFDIRIAAGCAEYDDLLLGMKSRWPGMMGYVTEKEGFKVGLQDEKSNNAAGEEKGRKNRNHWQNMLLVA